MLQRIHKHLIIEHRLLISFVFLLHLIHEELFLDEGIVQFGVGVTQLVVVDEEFEAFGEAGLGTVVFGQGGHELGVFDDEGGVLALGLDEVADQLVDEAGGVAGGFADYAVLRALFVEEFTGLLGGDVLGDGLAKFSLELLHHTDPLPGRREINLEYLIRILNPLWMMLHNIAPRDLLHHLREHILRQIQQIMEIRIRHIELTARILWIMRLINRLIPKVPANLIYPIQPPNDQLLQVQFRRNPHIQLHIEIVVVGDEGSGCGTPRYHIHHGGFDLEEVEVVEVLSDELYYFGAGVEGVAGAGVEDEVEETFAVAGLGVFEADAVLGDHVQAGGEELGVAGGDGELAGFGAGGVASNTDDVASADVLVGLGKAFLALMVVGAAHHLQLGSVALQIIEDQILTLRTDTRDSSRHRDSHIIQYLLVGDVLEFLVELSQGELHLIFVRIGMSLLLLLENVNSLAPILEVGSGIQLLLSGPPSRLWILLGFDLGLLLLLFCLLLGFQSSFVGVLALALAWSIAFQFLVFAGHLVLLGVIAMSCLGFFLRVRGFLWLVWLFGGFLGRVLGLLFGVGVFFRLGGMVFVFHEIVGEK